MKRILSIVVALLLVSGAAISLAYDGFDAGAGTGVLGVGQVQPPGLDEPPTELTATKVKTTRYDWQCVLPDTYTGTLPLIVDQFGVYEQDYVAEAEVRLNPHDKVLNYIFSGWVAGDKVYVDSSHTQSSDSYAGFEAELAPGCLNPDRSVQNVVVTTTFGDVFFTH